MVRKIIIGAVLVAAGALSAILPMTAPTRLPLSDSVREEIVCQSELQILIQGESVLNPGKYTVSADCTYGELFAMAGVSDAAPSFALNERIRFQDAVLIDGTYCIYLVL